MYRTVIFDLDGTLLNSIGDLAAAANYVCRQNGWPEHTEAEIMGMVGHGIPNLVKQFSPEDARSTLMVLNTTAQFNQYYGRHNIELTRPYDGVPALLKRLKAAGMRLAVCSNKADEFSRVIVEHYYPGVFDLVRGNLNGMPVKPDPAAAREILRKLDAVPASSVMVGDSSVDIQTGHNASLGKIQPKRMGGSPASGIVMTSVAERRFTSSPVPVLKASVWARTLMAVK